MSERLCKCGHGQNSHWGRPSRCQENIHPNAGKFRGAVEICRCEGYVKAKLRRRSAPEGGE